MKYKLITIFLIFFLVIGSILCNAFYKNKLNYVYHQHLEDSSDESACLGIATCTHLPIVSINTGGQEIPLRDDDNTIEIDGIGTSTNSSININTTNTITNYIIADMNVYDNGDEVNSLSDKAIDYQVRISYRGRSSIHFDKKGYSLKIVDENNKKVNDSFLGMPSDSDWVLHGPFMDRSLIRNYMWYNIGQEIMGQAPKTRFFEMYLDGEYQGLYLAVEAVTQSEKSRVKMEKFDKDSVATSYLIELDADVKEEITYLNSFSEYTYKVNSFGDHPTYLSIKYPDEENLTEEVKNYIYNDFNEFEKMLYSFDYQEYKDYIDVDSFVDYFIINEFTQNYDAVAYSTYIYKDLTGKYKMYIWDFNSANNNYYDNFLEDGKQSFVLLERIWYEKLMKDPEFVEIVIRRYKELRKTYLSEEYLFNYIDETVSYLGNSIDRNFEKWGYMFVPENDFTETHFHPTNYDEALNQLKEAIHKRGEWMDKNIEALRHYSHVSKNKKFNK